MPLPPTSPRILIFCGALLLALGVAAGAFGAHGLRHLVVPELLETWRTAAQYQMLHGLGLLLLAVLWPQLAQSCARWAGRLMLVGVLIFSGSLYLLVLTGTRVLGAITPIGGMLMISAWALIAWAAWRGRPPAQ
ncbi:DUF423 domain-containing protein [Castellaniella sp.]|uniref:DUF423 domain-containing protein n=1 Tax=Castellaniella sp. TaxID=1955812 RepID=UPI002AFEC461|nr:DUF423 domain-containing protein [Castellaniella sp.]